MLFITGTDTGVGKTLVACALATAWRWRKVRVGVMKPCETGCGEERIAADALALQKAAGSSEPIEEICTYRLRLPLSPEEAARAESIQLDLEKMVVSFMALQARHERLVVEGAGGLLAPVTEKLTMASLATLFGLPLVVVARAGLGTINHTLLTLEAARQRGLSVRAVVLVRSRKEGDESEAYNPEAIRRHGKVDVLGPLPFLESYPPDDVQLCHLAETYLADLLT